MLNKIEIVIQNRVSVSGNLLYIEGHVPDFSMSKGYYLAIITDTRHYQHYFHTDTVSNYHYISLSAIILQKK